jgi:heterodisulfide reductase subunit A
MNSVLVIGGGISGIKAAVDLGQMGVKTFMVERSEKLGGIFLKLGKTFPHGTNAKELLASQIQILKSLENVNIHTQTSVRSIIRENNIFKVILEPSDKTLEVGALILATGFNPFNATNFSNYGYGKYKNVITSLELLEIFGKTQGCIRPSDQKKPKSITFIQCIGSRDKKTHEYCSSFCCTYAVHIANIIKESDPSIDITIFYMDMRTFCNYESLFQEARALGVKFLRGKPAMVLEEVETNNLILEVENTVNREFLHHKTDMVVLSIGAEPANETDVLSETLGIKLNDRTGFFLINEEDDISAIGNNRIFVIGNASGPKDSQYSLSQASAAAMKVLITLGGK